MESRLSATTRLKQVTGLGERQQLGLHLLSRSLPELRAEVLHEIAVNPVLEDTDHPLERNLSDLERSRRDEDSSGDDVWPTDDFTALERRDDEESIERRQSIFDRQVAEETLQSHLTSQLALSDIAAKDRPLAEALIGDLDDNGYFRGSIPDACMVYGCTPEKIESTLSSIRALDPAGCGARNLKECLSAQLDKVPDAMLRKEVAGLLDKLEEIATGNADFSDEAIAALRRLDPHPGRAFVSEHSRTEYVNPEIHAVRGDDGRWLARTDRRSLPAIRISPRFRSILTDPAQSEETKAYIRERIERARAIQHAIAERQQTIENIAQAIFDRQQDCFSQGLRALRPMTESEIAAELGVAVTTVSRTVRDKYVSTPQGTIELRRFFTSGVKADDGEVVSQAAVLARLGELVNGEDASSPLSDERLATLLKKEGFPLARRTVAKYRDRLGIPPASARKRVYQ